MLLERFPVFPIGNGISFLAASYSRSGFFGQKYNAPDREFSGTQVRDGHPQLLKKTQENPDREKSIDTLLLSS
jgi:hypothetical protein